MKYRGIPLAIVLLVLLVASWPLAAGAVTFFDHPLTFEDKDPGENLGPYRAPEKPEPAEDKPVVDQPQDAKPKVEKPKEETTEDQDVEVSVDPETGKVSAYKPPAVVSSFMNDPTKEKAQAYLDWIENKSKKSTKAMAVLTEVVNDKKEAKKEEVLKQEEGRDRAAILSFITPECPHCASQVMALNSLLRDGWLGRVDVQAIMKSDAQSRDMFMKNKMVAFPISLDQGEFAAMNIDVWPTTLVMPAGTDKVLMYKGVVTTVDLKKALLEPPSEQSERQAQ
jgi:hypothetical protein